MPSANEAALDASLRQAVFLERFKGGEARRLLTTYRALEADLLATLAKRDPTAVRGRYRTARLQKLLADVREVIAAFSRQQRLDFQETVRAVAGIEGSFGMASMRTAVPVDWDWALPSVGQVDAAIHARPFQGRLLREWYSGLERATQERVRASITQGVIEGETTANISRRLRIATGQSVRGAEMVVRTAINHVSAVAREQFAQENASIIKGVRWVSTLDSRTSLICAARDGTVYPVDSGPRPPAHPNCRSSVAFVTKSWRELGINVDEAPEGTRASMDGQVPASTTYGEWLKTQPAHVQDEVLGRTKGTLFRRGELSVDRFLVAGGQELSIDQLRAKYPAAFEQAGLRGMAPVIPTDAQARGQFLQVLTERVESKARHYLLDEQNVKGKAKAHWLIGSLGFSPDNVDEFVRQVRYDPDAAKYSRITQWGERFTQIIALRGPNGRVMPAKFVWQVEDGIPRLVTMTPAKKKDLR